MLERTDPELLTAYLAGDARAFEVLYRRHATVLMRFLRRSVVDRSKADEVFQETWIQVVRYARGYEAHAQFRTWLFTLARSRVADVYRRNGARVDPSVALDSLVDEQATSEAAWQQSRQRRELEAALSQLPEAQREVFLLREVAEMTLPEVAEVVGEPYEAVKSRYRYALARLRELMKG